MALNPIQRHVREALLGLQLAHPLPAALVDELAYKLPTTLYGVESICMHARPPVEACVLLGVVTHAISTASRRATEIVAAAAVPPGALRPLRHGVASGDGAASGHPGSFGAFVPLSSPSPSPVLCQEDLYTAAGWVEGGVAGPAGGAERDDEDDVQTARAPRNGGPTGGGGGARGSPLCISPIPASSEEGDEEESGIDADADDDRVSARMAALVNQSIRLVPSSALLSSAGLGSGLPLDGGGAARAGSGEAVPCSLSEIYRLSNLNKRRSKQRTRLNALLAAASADGSSDSDAAAADDDDSNSDDELEHEAELLLLGAAASAHSAAGSDGEGDADEPAWRRGGGGGVAAAGAAAGIAEPSAEDPVLFMTRIGWLTSGGQGAEDSAQSIGAQLPVACAGADGDGGTARGGRPAPPPPPLPTAQQLQQQQQQQGGANPQRSGRGRNRASGRKGGAGAPSCQPTSALHAAGAHPGVNCQQPAAVGLHRGGGECARRLHAAPVGVHAYHPQQPAHGQHQHQHQQPQQLLSRYAGSVGQCAQPTHARGRGGARAHGPGGSGCFAASQQLQPHPAGTAHNLYDLYAQALHATHPQPASGTGWSAEAAHRQLVEHAQPRQQMAPRTGGVHSAGSMALGPIGADGGACRPATQAHGSLRATPRHQNRANSVSGLGQW